MIRCPMWLLAFVLVVGCGGAPETKPSAKPRPLVDLRTSPPRTNGPAEPASSAASFVAEDSAIAGTVVDVIDGDTVTFLKTDRSTIKVPFV